MTISNKDLTLQDFDKVILINDRRYRCKEKKPFSVLIPSDCAKYLSVGLAVVDGEDALIQRIVFGVGHIKVYFTLLEKIHHPKSEGDNIAVLTKVEHEQLHGRYKRRLAEALKGKKIFFLLPRKQ